MKPAGGVTRRAYARIRREMLVTGVSISRDSLDVEGWKGRTVVNRSENEY